MPSGGERGELLAIPKIVRVFSVATSIFNMEAPYLTEMELKYKYEVVVR